MGFKIDSISKNRVGRNVYTKLKAEKDQISVYNSPSIRQRMKYFLQANELYIVEQKL